MQSNAAVMQESQAFVPESLYRKRRSPSDIILKVLIYTAAVITVLVLVGIIAYILIRGVPYLSWQFLSTPYSETNMDQRGILPMIINTLYMVVISLLISTPIGISSAIYLTQYARQGRLVKTIRFTTEILSGVPSIIFGLFGYTVFCILFRLGTSILAGALTMTICILPTIVRTTEESLLAVPSSYKEGAGRGQTAGDHGYRAALRHARRAHRRHLGHGAHRRGIRSAAVHLRFGLQYAFRRMGRHRRPRAGFRTYPHPPSVPDRYAGGHTGCL